MVTYWTEGTGLLANEVYSRSGRHPSPQHPGDHPVLRSCGWGKIEPLPFVRGDLEDHSRHDTNSRTGMLVCGGKESTRAPRTVFGPPTGVRLRLEGFGVKGVDVLLLLPSWRKCPQPHSDTAPSRTFRDRLNPTLGKKYYLVNDVLVVCVHGILSPRPSRSGSSETRRAGDLRVGPREGF